jgi:hypothetical protein
MQDFTLEICRAWPHLAALWHLRYVNFIDIEDRTTCPEFSRMLTLH